MKQLEDSDWAAVARSVLGWLVRDTDRNVLVPSPGETLASQMSSQLRVIAAVYAMLLSLCELKEQCQVSWAANHINPGHGTESHMSNNQEYVYR